APPESVKFALVLTGTVDDMNKPLVEAMLDHLRRLTQDPNITFRKIRAGSVQIIFECSPLTLAKLRTLVACGELEDIKGFHIEQLTDAPDVINKPRIPRPEEKRPLVDVLPEAYSTLIRYAREMLRRERMSDTREPEALVHDTVLEMRDIEQSTWT